MQTSLVPHWGENFLNKLDLSQYKKILDIGCRQGTLSAQLANRYKKSKFIAIDNIPTEIELAKDHHQLPNLSFETADALKLECTESYEAIVSFSCLHWIKDKITVLENIYRALKPGGKVFLQFFALHGRLKNDRFFYQISQELKWKSYFHNFTFAYAEITASEFCSLLQNAGFILHRVEFDRYKTDFSHPEMLHQWFGTWTSHTKFLPLKKRDHFLNEAVQSYLKTNHYDNQNTFPYHEYVLEVICEKPLVEYTEISRYTFGNITFTPHEASILKHFLLGKTAKEMGVLKNVSPKTVEFHLAKIKEKINCYRRSEIYQAAYSYGFIRLIYDVAL